MVVEVNRRALASAPFSSNNDDAVRIEIKSSLSKKKNKKNAFRLTNSFFVLSRWTWLIVTVMGAVLMITLAANAIFFLGGGNNHGSSTRIFLERPFIPGVAPNVVPNTMERKDSYQQQYPDDKNHNNDENGRARVARILQEAGAEITPDIVLKLPTWKQVTDLYGEHAVILNQQEACAAYRDKVPAERRMLGAAGMFSTGTNLVTTLLKKNCKIPERVQLYGINASRELHGIRWQVPWGKHTQQQYRDRHATEHAKDIIKDDLLPVVTIRHPISWMNSMCKNPYTAKWSHSRTNCPHLLKTSTELVDEKEEKVEGTLQQRQYWNNVTVQYGAGTESYQSLAHLYNDWYHGYTQHAKYPWIMIRMEDLIFHTLETIQSVCSCVGGKLVQATTMAGHLEYALDSAKADSPGHDTSTDLVQAWIKYSKKPNKDGWTAEDVQATRQALDSSLLQQFGYSLQ